MKNKFILLIVIVYAALSAGFFALWKSIPEYSFMTLEIANTVMAILSLSTYIAVIRQVDKRPQAFVRGVMSASFVKLMVCMVSILVYVLLYRAHIHKPSVFVMFGIYAIYTILETTQLSKIARE